MTDTLTLRVQAAFPSPPPPLPAPLPGRNFAGLGREGGRGGTRGAGGSRPAFPVKLGVRAGRGRGGSGERERCLQAGG